VLHYLRSRDPLLRVDLEEPGDEVLGWTGDGVEELRIELVVGRGDLRTEAKATLPVLAEGWSPGRHDVENHPQDQQSTFRV